MLFEVGTTRTTPPPAAGDARAGGGEKKARRVRSGSVASKGHGGVEGSTFIVEYDRLDV